MLHIDLVVRAPIRVFGLKGVFVADDFAFEVCRERRMIIRETYTREERQYSSSPSLQHTCQRTLDAQIAAKERLAHVDVFQFHLHIVDLAIGLLGAREFASGTEKGRRGCRQQLRKSEAERVS